MRTPAIIVASLGAAVVLARPAGAVAADPAPAGVPAARTDGNGKVTDRKGVPTDKLTPIPVEPPRRRQPAYQLFAEADVPLLTIAAVFGIGRSIREGLAPAFCAPVKGSPVEATTHCDPQTLNWLDRQVAGRYHPGWGRWSDIGLYGLGALAVSGIVVDEGLKAGLNDLVVVTEATLLASAASGISTAMTGRPRPYMYGTDAPLAVREDGTGGLSYFSGHTSTSFGIVTAAFVTLHRLHPDDRWPWLVLAGGAAAAGFVGATRILAGSHFPTDVVAGAAVGSAIGVMVPALHAAPRGISATPMPVASGGGLAITGFLP
jgi:membrane-associated phospholipid phosphatase